MNWQGKRVLVTGAGGFIGSHLVEKLIGLGAKVSVVLRYNSRNAQGMIEVLSPELKRDIEVVFGDLRDPETVREAIRGKEIIFHLAALVAIPYSYVHPREVVDTNIMGTLNVLNAARDCSVEKMIHASTSEVYGTAQYVPIDEKHPLQGQSPYSASKIGAEMLAQSFYRSYNTQIAIVRPFNAYGPRQSTRAVIPTIVYQALTQEQIELGSLHPTRDYTYVEDVVEAFIKVAESARSIGEVVNIGSNFEISIGDIATKVLKITGENKQIVTDPRRIRPPKSEVERLWCDNTKAKRLLGWQPKVNFDEGLSKTIKWISSHLDLYKPGL